MSLEQFKQPEVIPGGITTPELVQKRQEEYLQAKEALRNDNEKYLKKANKIDSEDAKRIALARLGRVSIDASEEDLRLRERLGNLRS